VASFDWVTARAKCSLERTFQTLAEIVDSDIKAANNLGKTCGKFPHQHQGARKSHRHAR
jgi:hypothetical protein